MVKLPSGSLSVVAQSGDLVVNGALDLSGIRRDFKDVSTFTSGGQIALTFGSTSVVPYVKQGKLIALGVTGAEAEAAADVLIKNFTNFPAYFTAYGGAAPPRSAPRPARPTTRPRQCATASSN